MIKLLSVSDFCINSLKVHFYLITDRVTCGGTITRNGTYFQNPNAPSPYTDTRTCSVTVRKSYPGICQIRLDFLYFELREPNSGTCEQDRFVVSGQDDNDIVPPICGQNNGQHSKFHNESILIIDICSILIYLDL